ncbi:uncharacterized protein LOC143227939 [Tachypleus tridentatus]|uniref:uncharacterized protein LOC143227939 n=1 Tax=Tachypleus tridentatus TaxID=6853 RepID=UPI003FD65E49
MSLWRTSSEERVHVPGSEVVSPSTSHFSGSRLGSPSSSLRYRSPSPSNSSSHVVAGSPYQETILLDGHITSANVDTCVRPSSPQNTLVRRVTIKQTPRHPDNDIGLELSGGKGNGERIFVSGVLQDSIADRAGVTVGDQIIAVNNISVLNLSLREVTDMLYSTSRKFHLTLVSSRTHGNTPRGGPHPYLWVDSDGRPVSPPSNTPYHRGRREDGVRTVNLTVDKSLPLGLFIRGGVEQSLGIFVTGVERPSAADLAGLKVGDQILSVNDRSFQSVTHDEAVGILKFSPHMIMTVQHIGKIPHACTPRSGQSRPHDPQKISSPRLSRRESSRMKEKHRELGCDQSRPTEDSENVVNHKVKEDERIYLAYYCKEYETGAMTVDALVTVLMKWLEIPEKNYLLDHIRGIVRPDDLDRYDDLIYKHKIQVLKNKEAVKQTTDQSQEIQPLRTTSPLHKDVRSPRGSFRKKTPFYHRLTVPDELHHHKVAPPAENERTPSQDGGVDIANENRFKYTTPKGTRTLLDSRFHETSDKRHKSHPFKSPRLLPRRSFDVRSATKEVNSATLLRRLTLRRHSSGGEGVNPDGRRVANREIEDRRWSIGSGLISAFRKDKPKPSCNSPSQRDHSSPTSSPRKAVQENCTNWLQVPHVRVRRHRSLPDPHAILPRKHQQLGPPLNQHRSASVRLPVSSDSNVE